MKTIYFEECNSNNETGDLPCYHYDEGVICCWKPTLAERIKLLLTGRIWVSVLGEGVPPMLLTTKKPIRRYRITIEEFVKQTAPHGIGVQQEGAVQDG